MNHTLNYVRVANAKKDGYDGFLYIHHWPSGWEELIFASHTLANKFINKLNNKIEANESTTQKP